LLQTKGTSIVFPRAKSSSYFLIDEDDVPKILIGTHHLETAQSIVVDVYNDRSDQEKFKKRPKKTLFMANWGRH
jgi:hypothetical protein